MTVDFNLWFLHENTKPGATEDQIRRLKEADLGTMPDDYLDFLMFSNGYVGCCRAGSYVDLWNTEDIPIRNVGYCVAEFVPGLLLIGSSGGGAAYGVDTRCAPAPRYVEVDFITMAWDEVYFESSSFVDLLSHIRDR